MLTYMSPLFEMRLLWIQKNILPCSVPTSALRHSLRQSHLRHVAKAVSTSWASTQSTMCIGASFATCTLASWLKCSCSSKSSLRALTSPWLAALTIAPSRRDWTVSQLWLMGTRLNASVTPLLAPFWYPNLT